MQPTNSKKTIKKFITEGSDIVCQVLVTKDKVSCDVLLVTVEDEVYKDMASTPSFETSYEVRSSGALDVDMCVDDSTRDGVDHEVSDVDSISCYSAYLGGEHEVVQEMECEMIYNLLFETNATWSYDNPLFELDVDHALDSRSDMSIDCSVWDPCSASGFQTRLIEEISEMYMVRSAYSFTFDPHVHDLVAHVMDNLSDSLPCVEI